MSPRKTKRFSSFNSFLILKIEESYKSKKDAVIFVIDTNKDILEFSKEENDTVYLFFIVFSYKKDIIGNRYAGNDKFHEDKDYHK